MRETNAHLTADEIAEELSDDFEIEEVRDEEVVVRVTENWNPKQTSTRLDAASSTVLTVYGTDDPDVFIVEDSDFEPVTEVKDISEAF